MAVVNRQPAAFVATDGGAGNSGDSVRLFVYPCRGWWAGFGRVAPYRKRRWVPPLLSPYVGQQEWAGIWNRVEQAAAGDAPALRMRSAMASVQIALIYSLSFALTHLSTEFGIFTIIDRSSVDEYAVTIGVGLVLSGLATYFAVKASVKFSREYDKGLRKIYNKIKSVCQEVEGIGLRPKINYELGMIVVDVYTFKHLSEFVPNLKSNIFDSLLVAEEAVVSTKIADEQLLHG